MTKDDKHFKTNALPLSDSGLRAPASVLCLSDGSTPIEALYEVVQLPEPLKGRATLTRVLEISQTHL